MAKDGTNRGGRRVRAGTKPDALSDKIADKRTAKVLEPLDFDIDDSFEADDLIFRQASDNGCGDSKSIRTDERFFRKASKFTVV